MKDHTNIPGTNSYFCAYLEVHGIKDGDEVKFHEYSRWITGKHKEFRLLIGCPFYNGYPPDVQKEFKVFLRRKQSTTHG